MKALDEYASCAYTSEKKKRMQRGGELIDAKSYFIYFLFLTKRKESKEGVKNVPSKRKKKKGNIHIRVDP